jgi:hypothetical protein
VTGASEWRRAGIAVSGVTLVLLIAGAIHFLVPARPSGTPLARAIETVPEPAAITASPTPSRPMVNDVRHEQSMPAPQQPLRMPPARHLKPGLQDVVAVGSPKREVGAPELAAPLVARLEIPEDTLQFEPMRMPVSPEFAVPALSVPLPASGDDQDAAARTAHQRDPVTAAFVTAGNAVAGGFRTAGRAIKRAF